MKRKAAALAMLAALGGCVSVDKTNPQQTGGQFGGISRAREVPGVQGPMGEPVPVTTAQAPTADASKKSGGLFTAGGTMSAGTSRDAGVVTANATVAAGSSKDSGIVQTGGGTYGKRPGVPAPPPGAVAAVGALPGIPVPGPGMGPMVERTSVRFTGPAGMRIGWFAASPMAPGGFTPAQVEVPGRFNFVQGGIYRLKLYDIPNRPNLDLYPTLQVMPANSCTATFLAHSTVPVGFTEEDFEQVTAGNFVVKVIYLPSPQFQDLAVAGPDEVVSTRLEPGVDPILEAARRGTILCIIRIGNINLEMPFGPAMNSPPNNGSGPFQGMPLMAPPGAVPPGTMPPGAMPASAARTNAGRATVLSPSDPPTMTLPDAPKPTGQVNVSADAMFGRIK